MLQNELEWYIAVYVECIFDRRYVVVENLLAEGDISVKDIARLGKELSELSRVTALSDDRLEKIKTIRELLAVEKEEGAKGDEGEELMLMAKEEREECETDLQSIEEEIIKIMTPKDEADDGGVILEVRAGTGNVKASWNFASLQIRVSKTNWLFFFFFSIFTNYLN